MLRARLAQKHGLTLKQFAENSYAWEVPLVWKALDLIDSEWGESFATGETQDQAEAALKASMHAIFGD